MIVGLSHTDLDGVSSAWLVDKIYQTEEIVKANYNEIRGSLEFLFEKYGKVDLIISDLYLAPEDVAFVVSNFRTVVIFDHHPQSARYLPANDEIENFTIHYDESKSATKIIYDHTEIIDIPFTDVERKYVELVNIFDLWKIDSPEFVYARMANDLMFHYGWDVWFDKLKSGNVPDIPNGLTKEELKLCRDVFEKINSVKDTAQTIETNHGSTIVFLDSDERSAINFVPQLFTSKTNIFYIVTFVGFYKISIRCYGDIDVKLGKEIAKFSESVDVIQNAGGHDKAAGFSFKKDVKLETVVDVIDKFEDYIFEGNSV